MPPNIGDKKNGGGPGAFSHRRFPHTRNLKNLSERLKTFRGWTVSFIDYKKLAELGFYYTNTDDVVRCAFCDIQLGFWGEGDDPAADHLRESPNCPMAKGEVPSSEQSGEETEENAEGEVPSQDVCGLEIRPFSGPERPGKAPYSIDYATLWRDFERLGVSKISAPAYATYEARLASFKNWPAGDIQRPEKLAEAGFYHTGCEDQVMCHHCGGGLQNWEVEDDPWVEHAKWFMKCGFVVLRKGWTFIVEVFAKEKQELARLSGRQNEEGAETEREALAIPQPPEPGKGSQPSPTTKSEEREMELCRICYLRERRILFLPCGHFVSCADCASSLNSCAVCRKPFETAVPAYLSSTSRPAKESQPSPTTKFEDKEKEVELCRVCYKREMQIVFLPCGHFVSCTECASSLSACAFCRKPFEAAVRAYLS